MNELRIPLQPKQQIFRQAMEKYPVVFYGGAKGGGKSYSMRNIWLLRRFQYPGSFGVIFRRSYPELEANHIRPLLDQHPGLRQYWHESKKLLTLPNGSRLQFCYCKNESDVDLYQGWEIHDLGIEEAGQWTETMIQRLRGSNRSSQPGIRPRTGMTGNPGGIGHSYLKRIFVERRFKDSERPDDHYFIQALVDDNAALMENDPDYVHRLNSEPNEALRRAYRFGDWDIFAGQFFGEIDRRIHLIEPFEIPVHWSREAAYDYGFNHPAAFGWFATNEDGDVFMYRELVKAGLRVDQYCKELLKFDDTRSLQKITAGLDCWAKRSATINEKQGQNPPTVAEEFSAHGLYLRPATVDRIQGANQVRKYLAWQGRPNKRPRFFMFNTCQVTFDCLTRMQTDPARLEDVLKVDAIEGDPNTGDDPYDVVRYHLMSRPLLADQPPKPKPGDPDYDRLVSEQLFQHNLERLQKEKENRDGQGINWQTDEQGIPAWNRWDDDSGGNPFGQF